jgi:hypothetical protein
MKNLMLTALFASVSSFLFAQCQDTNLPNRPVPGFISTVQTNYGNQAIGEITDFELKPFTKLSGHHIILKFDLAYAYFPGRYDSLLIMASADCGKTWETLLYSGGQELSTTEPTTEYFSPTRSEYQSYEFDLFKFSGPIRVRFRFINGNGNNLYLDNLGYQDGLSATHTPGTEMKSSITPNPVKDSGFIQLNRPVNNGTIMIMDTNGHEWQRMENQVGNQIEIEARKLNPGIYFYLLQEEGMTKSYGQFVVVN